MHPMLWLFAFATLSIAPGVAFAPTPPPSVQPIPLALQTPATRTFSFYSQFDDISSPSWRKVGCGVASLAMIIDYYKPDAVTVNTLLKEGIASGAYDKKAGWIYKGLIGLSGKYGLDGAAYDYSSVSASSALAKLSAQLEKGPVIASVHYKFDPKSTIPHLVVIESIKNGEVYYSDPAAKSGHLHLSTEKFLKAWKRRVVVIRPVAPAKSLVALRR